MQKRSQKTGSYSQKSPDTAVCSPGSHGSHNRCIVTSCLLPEMSRSVHHFPRFLYYLRNGYPHGYCPRSFQYRFPGYSDISLRWSGACDSPVIQLIPQSCHDLICFLQHGMETGFLQRLVAHNEVIGLIIKILLEIQAELTGHNRGIDHVLISAIVIPQIIETEDQKQYKRH